MKETKEKLNKHQAKTEATLRSVLDAAEEVFVRDGYERAQMEAIASQAGRTKGALYAHFRSKEEIFFALLERKAAGRREAFLRSAKDASGQRQMEVIKELFLSTLEEDNWPILMLEFKLFALRSKDSAQHVRALYRLLYTGIDQLFPRLGITTRKAKDRANIGLAVLRSMTSAIVLEKQFNPVLDQPGATRQALGAAFDCLLGINGQAKISTPQKNPRQPAQRPAAQKRVVKKDKAQ